MATNRVDALIAQAQQLTPDELTQLIEGVVQVRDGRETESAVPDYPSFFGAGRGSFQTAEEVVRYIRQERDEWEP
jgi:hypothetical protein